MFGKAYINVNLYGNVDEDKITEEHELKNIIQDLDKYPGSFIALKSVTQFHQGNFRFSQQ